MDPESWFLHPAPPNFQVYIKVEFGMPMKCAGWQRPMLILLGSSEKTLSQRRSWNWKYSKRGESGQLGMLGKMRWQIEKEPALYESSLPRWHKKIQRPPNPQFFTGIWGSQSSKKDFQLVKAKIIRSPKKITLWGREGDIVSFPERQSMTSGQADQWQVIKIKSVESQIIKKGQECEQ